MSERYATCFAKLAELHLARGGPKLCDVPGLCPCEIDEQWRAELNGHDEPIGNVPEYHAMIYFNGWPVGLIHPFGGCLLAGAEADLIAALDKAIQAEVAHAS